MERPARFQDRSARPDPVVDARDWGPAPSVEEAIALLEAWASAGPMQGPKRPPVQGPPMPPIQGPCVPPGWR